MNEMFGIFSRDIFWQKYTNITNNTCILIKREN